MVALEEIYRMPGSISRLALNSLTLITLTHHKRESLVHASITVRWARSLLKIQLSRWFHQALPLPPSPLCSPPSPLSQTQLVSMEWLPTSRATNQESWQALLAVPLVTTRSLLSAMARLPQALLIGPSEIHGALVGESLVTSMSSKVKDLVFAESTRLVNTSLSFLKKLVPTPHPRVTKKAMFAGGGSHNKIYRSWPEFKLGLDAKP